METGTILILFGFSILLLAIGLASRGSSSEFFGYRFTSSTTFVIFSLFVGMFATLLFGLKHIWPLGYSDIFGNWRNSSVLIVWIIVSLVAAICHQAINEEHFKSFRNFYFGAAIITTLGIILPVFIQDYNPRKTDAELSATNLIAPAKNPNDSLSDPWSRSVEIGDGEWGITFKDGQDVLVRNQCEEVITVNQNDDGPPQFGNCGGKLTVQFKSISGKRMRVTVKQQPNRLPFSKWLSDIGKSF